MATTLFMTGATGYVGGSILNDLCNTLPNVAITALVRTEQQASLLTRTYANITIVIGTLDSTDLLISHASKADIVLHVANIDYAPGTYTLLEGVKQNPNKNALFIVMSGSGSLIDAKNINPGIAAAKIYSDVADAREIYDLPRNRIHVEIERHVQEESEAAGIKTVILAPGQIFTDGRGVGTKTSYLNEHPKAIVEYGKPFVIGGGENVWSWVAIGDLASAVITIIRATQEGNPKLGFNKKGYYFCQTGYLTAREQAEVLGRELKRLGAIEREDVTSISPEKARELTSFGEMLWGTSMRSSADRLRELGWEPQVMDWRSLVQRAAREEVERRR